MTIAKGSWQKRIWSALRSGRPIVSPTSWLQGRAKNYVGRYDRSFRNMLARAEKAGYVIERTPGIRGGEWSATYRLVAEI